PSAPPRRLPSATTMTEPSSPRPSSGAPAPPPCGNISAPARRRRLATTRPEPPHRRHERQPSRPDCGFRSSSDGTRCRHKVTGRLWCSAVRFAAYALALPSAASPRPSLPAHAGEDKGGPLGAPNLKRAPILLRARPSPSSRVLTPRYSGPVPPPYLPVMRG